MGSVIDLLGALVIVIITTFALNNIQTRRKRQNWQMKYGCQDPPMFNHKDPLFGLDLYLENVKNVRNLNFLNGWKHRYQKYGHTFKGNFMGRPSIYTVNARNLQSVHALNFELYGVQQIRRAPTLPFLGEGVFTMDGPFWKHSRALLRPTFTKDNVANLPAFEVHFQKFLKLLPADGSTVDLRPLLYRLFFDTSTEFLFGESMDTLSTETTFRTQEFLDAFHYAQRGMGIRIQMGKLRFLHRDKKWRDCIKVAHAFADTYVEKALQFREKWTASQDDEKSGGNEEKIDKLDLQPKRYVLLEEMAKETDNKMDLRHKIIHVFLAGHDSSGITIGHAIFHLCRHPEKWKKLHEEVAAADDEALTFESLKRLKYLQYVIKETIRLHPVAPTDTRIAYQDTMLPTGGGQDGTSPIFIPKGSGVTTNWNSLHRLAPCFQPDADEFRPERWETVRPGWYYLPFGGGPRICPGRQLALTEVAYVIARMAQEWKIIECRDEVKEWVEDLKITANSRNGIKVGLMKA